MAVKDLTNSTTKVILPSTEDANKKSSRAPATLILIEGPKAMISKQWTLDSKSATIGRFETSEILVPKKSLSKAHARISYVDGIYSIADLGATNGTSVNGKKLKAYATYQLRHNDQIKAANVVFRFLDKP